MSENQFTCRRCGSPVSIDDFDWRDFNLFDIQKKRRLCHDCIEKEHRGIKPVMIEVI